MLLGCVPLLFWGAFEDCATLREKLNRAAYVSNHFTRQFGRDLELLTRPNTTLHKRFFLTLSLPFSFTLAISGYPWHTLFTCITSFLPGNHLKFIELKGPQKAIDKPLRILSLNACLREGFLAPITGGIVPPFEEVCGYPSRVEALADWVGKQAPDIFFGQEFNDLNAIQTFISVLKTHGFTHFLYDYLLHPFTIKSGLFIASKRKIGDPSLISFSIQDRSGISKFARRGALVCSLLDEQDQPILRLYNAHLDAGADQTFRNHQLTKHVLPLFEKEKLRAILAGDFNFDTSIYSKEAGLGKFTNIFEASVTQSDEGRIKLRGFSTFSTEQIDVLMSNLPSLQFFDKKVEQVKSGDDILSDHFSISASFTL